MKNLNIENITKNILRLLDYSNVSDKEFSNILSISEKQFRLIKSRTAKFSIANINKSCDFFNVTLDSINEESISIDNMFREQLAYHHANNSEYLIPLTRRPSIKHAIRFELLYNENFTSTGMTVAEIKNIFLQRGWKYTSNYISTSLNRYSELVNVIGNTFERGKKIKIYRAK